MDRQHSDGATGEFGSPQAKGQKFLSYRDLEERYGKSRMTLWRWVRMGRLPAPYQLGPNTVGFSLREILNAEARLKRTSYAPEAAA